MFLIKNSPNHSFQFSKIQHKNTNLNQTFIEMIANRIHYAFLRLLIWFPCVCLAQLEQTALEKITTVEALIADAEANGMDALKEKMTVRTAEVFLGYANWDEQNVAINADYFTDLPIYKDNAQTLAEDLPDFMRNEIIIMLDEAIATLNALIDGTLKRAPTPKVNWAEVYIDGNKVMYQGRPVFLSDYIWKPGDTKLTAYFGDKDGVFMTPADVADASGTIKSNLLNTISGKGDGTFGSIFLNHKVVPNWAETNYGPGFKMRQDTYTAYDIDNPGARELQGFLLAGTVPQMAGKKFSELGYMLCNEPHFITTANGTNTVWASGPVSEYSKDKFRTWLQSKHGDIAVLNTLWGTSFASFADVTIEIPIDIALQGTPMWYDWQRFNMDRVTDWFTFLRDEIQSHDPNAKVHIKVMPTLWSFNRRDTGLDMEALTKLSGIIGNDAGAHNSYMWGGPEHWEAHYNFEWRELAMSYDFYKSVQPNLINYNSEGHFLSTGRSRDLYLKPSYAREAYWLAVLQGMNVIETWVWARRSASGSHEEGAIHSPVGKGYAGSNNQQPRIINEVEATIMDLNAHSEHITELQNIRKSIRIFNTNTTPINRDGYMDDTFDLYEALFFEGLSIGFATEQIIKAQNNSQWDAIMVYKTEYVTDAEFDALQTYLNTGGKLIIDAVSLKKDEYGRNRATTLNTNTGGMIISANAVSDYKSNALSVVSSNNHMPFITVNETNNTGHKGCVWKSYKTAGGKHIVNIINIGKTEATLSIQLPGASNPVSGLNLLTGQTFGLNFTMAPEAVLLAEIKEIALEESQFTITVTGETCPNANNGIIEIVAELEDDYIVDLNGTTSSFTKAITLENIAPGTYGMCISVAAKNFERCFEIEVSGASTMSGKMDLGNKTLFVRIHSGTPPFTVRVNNTNVLQSVSKEFNISIAQGDEVVIASKNACEGLLVDTIDFTGIAKSYPNPTYGPVTLKLPIAEKNVKIDIFSVHSQLINSAYYAIENQELRLNMANYPNGIYFIKVNSTLPLNFKIVKQ